MALEGIRVGQGNSAWIDASNMIGVSVHGDDGYWHTANLSAGEAVEVIRQLAIAVEAKGITLNAAFFENIATPSGEVDDGWR